MFLKPKTIVFYGVTRQTPLIIISKHTFFESIVCAKIRPKTRRRIAQWIRRARRSGLSHARAVDYGGTQNEKRKSFPDPIYSHTIDQIVLTSMCSASHPSRRAIDEPILRAKHFLPSSELPPYPLP